jgi:AraC family transcriptional regulator
MNKHSTVLDYSRRVEKVIAHIASHLDAALDLETLAGVAAFSPCHFHRIYRYVTGETAADTLRRLRLHRAAGELVQDTVPVAAIAKRAGYGSVAAFTRAFGAAYGIAPAAYRAQGRLVAPASSANNEESAVYDVEIRSIKPVRLAALRHAGSYMEIGGTFDRLFAWGAGRGLVGPATRSFGIYYDDPGSVPLKELRSDATFTIADGAKVDGDVRAITLEGGRYAVIQHKGPYAELERAYRWLYRDWLPQSGEDAANRPPFEEYVKGPKGLPPAEWLTEVCLPLAGR